MMDLIYNLGYYLALFIVPFVLYFLLFKKSNGRSVYTGRDWFYLVKFYFAKNAVGNYQKEYSSKNEALKQNIETGFDLPTSQHVNSQCFNGVDQKGNSISIKFTVRYNKVAEVYLCLRLADGNIYVLPEENRIRLTKIPKDEWRINGLNIELLEPFTRSKISFNGLLQNVGNKDYKKIEHIYFSFIFNSCGSPTYIPNDMDTNLLADCIAKQNWKDGSWVDYLIDQNGYEQFGVLQGFLKGNSYPEEYILNLAACRTKLRGLDDRFVLTRALRIFLADTYGNLINIVIKSSKNGCTQFNYGSVITSDTKILPIKGVDISLDHFGNYKILPEIIVTEIEAKGKLFKCVINLNKAKLLEAIDDEENGFEHLEVPAECDVNVNQAKAIVEFWYTKNGTFTFTPNTVLKPKVVDVLPNVLVTNIKSEYAKIVELTGGKGASLALLSSLSSSDFIVPDGFVITVKAFQHQLKSNVILSKSTKLLEDVCYGRKEGNIETICNEIVGHFKKEKILPEIATAILEELNKVELGWAVRSSAIGEDSEELSSAGQNETFLGCVTEDQILKSVAACWASLFSYQSVYYRWQHGLPVLSEMAVVLQKMVPADAAGVLFTCHPFSFNPSQMIISSNFGLGESVVSGKSDPDTFVLSRTWDDQVCLLDQNIGRKNKIFRMTANGVEETDDDGFEFIENWSVSNKQILQLGNVGMLLEKTFGGPRDIEWAFYKDKLYLLQSRPITTLNSWSEFDLTTELDYPIRSDYTVLSIGNINEVIPSAMSVLSQTSSILAAARSAELRFLNRFDPYGLQCILRRQHRGVMDVVNFVHKNVNKDVKITSTILDLAVFGHPILDEKMNDICKNIRGVTPPIALLKEIFDLLCLAMRNYSFFTEMKEMVLNMKLDLNQANPLIVNYKKIDDVLAQLPYILKPHTIVSSISVFYQAIAMNTLLEGSKTLTMDHCRDFATILSCCSDIVSAEIPMYLEKIARIIRDEGYNEQFCTIKPEFGVTWLERKCPEAFKLFQEFLQKHGHRSNGEFEVMEVTWRENPSKIISMIQANAKQESNIHRSNLTSNDIIKNLVSPKSAITRIIIKFIINRIRSSVSVRELTKCELVKAFDILRQAYRQLSEQMVSEGLLPSANLIYHLTHYEIGQVIQNRSPVLITKAMKRQKLYPKWNKIKFPEITFGVPIPENETETMKLPVDKVCSGTAACAGTVEGRACVIQSLDEIDQLQTGDILVTVSTDIGWSPYFPMLSGIITELGGLISHGAVVAREYGLPCIVGVRDATKVFKTGDIVIMNGNTGKVGKTTDLLIVM